MTASGELRVESSAASWVAGKGETILQPVTLDIAAGQLVAIIGPSGAGKTTLLEVLAGVRAPSAGQVRHNATGVGYVPQQDIVHSQLPLESALTYAALLRSDASPGKVSSLVAEVLDVLGLTHLRTQRVATLSGGERKRASVAVELLGHPAVLFLDEPTSGLDPVTARDVMRHLKAIAARGSTVVFTTHNPGDISFSDEVLAVAFGGQLAFAGPPLQAREHFQAASYEEIYDRLAEGVSPWPQTNRVMESVARPVVAPSVGAWRQWWLLTRRNAELLVRNKLTLAILAGSPVVIALMFLMLFQPGAFDFAHPSPSTTVMILFWIAFGGFFFGLTYGLSQIADEFAILRTERRAGLRLLPYVLSKVASLLPLLLVVDALLLGLLSATDRLPSADTGAMFLTLALTSLCALTLGLLSAAVVNNPSQAALMLPMLCFPQVLFVGAFLPVPVMAEVGRWLSYAMTNRWAFEALGNIAGLPNLWQNGGSPLGPPLLASYGDSFATAPWVDWVILAAFAVASSVGTVAVLRRKVGVRR
ncbi:ATP-binding cassette domain-containing protein [Actinocrispum sp. NPDC049592]|uniref:ABC transporter ATP-binding protein/permease n=1 Tax=Actinocrispum sp. NPDC049592 TaxID=3154835 RepID=UPI003416C77E